MSVENLDLNGPQLAVLDGLGIKTAGELDDLLEGRTVKTYDKPGAIMLPVHGKPSSEWAEAVRAPLRAALALVKPTAAAEKPG